jgi:hypothetical protein
MSFASDSFNLLTEAMDESTTTYQVSSNDIDRNDDLQSALALLFTVFPVTKATFDVE